jgi:hypothetical protein
MSPRKIAEKPEGTRKSDINTNLIACLIKAAGYAERLQVVHWGSSVDSNR